MRNALRTTADLVVILAGLTAIYVLAQREFAAPTAQSLSKTYQPGERLSGLPLEAEPGSNTLLLVLNSRCRFCTDSMAFYRRLVDARNGRKAAVKIVAVGTEPVDVLREYVRAHHVDVDSVITIKPGVLRPTGTPAVILIDSTWSVVDSWPGMLDTRGEEAVMKLAVTSERANAGE